MAKELTAKTLPAEKTKALAKKGEKAEAAESSGPDIGARLGKILRAIVILVLVILLGAAFGVVAYLFVPLGVQALLQPVEENSTRIATLEAELAALEAEQAETAGAQQEFLAEQQDRLDEMVTTLGDQNAELASQADMLDEFEALLDDFDATLNNQEETLTDFDARVDTLEEELPGSAEFAALNRNVVLLTAWQEVLKARLRLVQNNPGAALDELALAQSTLQALYEQSGEEQQAELDPILERLELVVANITANPFAATEDLEIVWHDLDRLINAGLSERQTPAP